MNSSFFLTDVRKDWPDNNLSVLQEVIFEAQAAVQARTNTDDDPMLDSPNLPNLRGYLRWAILQKLLDEAASSNRFDGIRSRWVDLGGISVLELVGAYTRVTACYLAEKDDPPRESEYRKSSRVENEVYQTLFEMSQGSDDDKLTNLLLVYGGKRETFAFLRSYSDPENRSAFLELSKNIMLMPRLLDSLAFEQIEDPHVELNEKTGVQEDQDEATQ